MGQAVVIPPKPKPEAPKVSQPIVEPTKVAVQDSPRKDTATSKPFVIKKGGEANLQMLPPMDTTQAEVIEMPLQGPNQRDTKADPILVPHAEIPEQLQDSQPTVNVEIMPLLPPRLQRFTPSSMLDWGQWEAKLFQQVYSQTRYFDMQGKPQAQGNLSSYYSGIASITLGCNRWFNFGAEAWLRSVRIDAPDASPFKVLGFQSGPNSRTALSAIGPKLKFQPFAHQPGFSLQTALLIPVGRQMEANSRNQPYLATENLQWWTQFYYTWNFARRWMLFAQLDAYAALNTGGKEQTQPSSFALPASVYLSCFPSPRFTVYAYNQVWPTVSTVWYQAGMGGKYRIAEGLELEASYGRFLAGIGAAGQANAFNLGIRFVKW